MPLIYILVILMLLKLFCNTGGILIKVGVTGANGKMGRQVVSSVLADSETSLVCAVDRTVRTVYEIF